MCGPDSSGGDSDADIYSSPPAAGNVGSSDQRRSRSRSSKYRRPGGTRRRQLEWVTNFALIVVSLFGISVGSGLLAFYKLHLLSFISYEFALVPTILLGGGFFTLLVSIVGLVATSRRSPVLLLAYAFVLVLAAILLVVGVIASVRIIFIISIKINPSLAKPLIQVYGQDESSTETWDTLHETYRCCGAETALDLGYMAWEDVSSLRNYSAVPDSCCIDRKPRCGRGIFKDHHLDKMASYVQRIHVHGCIEAMEYVLIKHVVPILTTFSAVGSLLAMVELLGVVLACCLAYALKQEQLRKARQERKANLNRINVQVKTARPPQSMHRAENAYITTAM